jgi:hypothetical protein
MRILLQALLVLFTFAGPAAAQDTGTTDPDPWTSHGGPSWWQEVLGGAPFGQWIAVEGGFDLVVENTAEALSWALYAPDGTLLSSGSVDGMGVADKMEGAELEVLFACMNRTWVPWLVLPNGRWISLAPWIDTPSWDFTWDCDPHEGQPPPLMQDFEDPNGRG